MDKWILSRLQSLIKYVDEGLENYRITETARAMNDFVDELSNWYIRRGRERYWGKEMTQDKINAYMTLYTTLVELAKISAPMIPFMADDIYRNLVCSIDKNAPISVHLCDFPAFKEEWIDKDLETNMKEVLDIVVLGRSCRNSANIKNRQPIGKMFVKSHTELDDFFKAIIAEELNVKKVEFKDDVKDFTSYSFKPQLRTLGPKYGKFIGEIRNALAEIDGNAAMDELNANGVLKLQLSNIVADLEKEDLLIETAQVEGFESVSDYGITVILDTNLTEELIEEGFVREIISKIQTMRKDSGYEVMDHIVLYHSGNDKIKDIIAKNKDEIMEDVLADDIKFDTNCDNEKAWDINGEKVNLGLERL